MKYSFIQTLPFPLDFISLILPKCEKFGKCWTEFLFEKVKKKKISSFDHNGTMKM